jgi:molecular chaperone Hsp33
LTAGLAGGGELRWAVADLTHIVEAVRLRLDLSPVASAALGRSLAASALLLRLAAKTPERLVLEIRGGGPLRRVVAEADHQGSLRGLVGEPRVDLPPTPQGKLDVGRAVGAGRLRVVREQAGGSYHSQVELVSGEIGEDVAHYLKQSEQRSSAVLLGVLARKEGITSACGAIVEVLPGASSEVIDRVEANVRQIGGISRFAEPRSLGEVQESLLAGLDVETLEERPLAYRCRCSRERLGRHLAHLAQGEQRRDLEELRLEDGSLEAECAFCGERYRYTLEELQGTD